MTRVYYTRMSVEERMPADRFEYLVEQVPIGIREKINKYRRWQDAQACLFGKILLLQCFQEFYPYCSLDDLQYTDYNRPQLNQDIDFNISHAGEYVICVVSDNLKVGIDIEEIRSIEFGSYSSQFTHKEWESIISSTNMSHAFFQLWTQKEALIKANGKGLSIPLKSVLVNDSIATVENSKWYLNELHIDKNYCCHLATDKYLDQHSFTITTANILDASYC